jgi:hypothetical protein
LNDFRLEDTWASPLAVRLEMRSKFIRGSRHLEAEREEPGRAVDGLNVKLAGRDDQRWSFPNNRDYLKSRTISPVDLSEERGSNITNRNGDTKMRINNNNALDLSGVQGEDIGVTVEETAGNPVLVSYALKGRTASLSPNGSRDSFSFKLDKGAENPALLTMLFTFTGSNGHYDITVQGDPREQTSHFSVIQRFNIPGNSITYTFDIT